MLHYYTDANEDTRASGLKTFADVAVNHYLGAKRLHMELIELHKLSTWNPTDEFPSTEAFDHLERLFQSQEKYFQSLIISITSLCAFMEGLINEAGSIALGNDYYSKYLERLSPVAKWEIVTLICLKVKLTELGALKPIQNLFRQRDSIMHYKSILRPPLSRKDIWPKYGSALEEGIHNVRLIKSVLMTHDPDELYIRLDLLDSFEKLSTDDPYLGEPLTI